MEAGEGEKKAKMEDESKRLNRKDRIMNTGYINEDQNSFF
jgi:hypothetical protein